MHIYGERKIHTPYIMIIVCNLCNFMVSGLRTSSTSPETRRFSHSAAKAASFGPGRASGRIALPLSFGGFQNTTYVMLNDFHICSSSPPSQVNYEV